MADLEHQPVEIELKYQVARDLPNTIENLVEWLESNATSGGEDELKNIYFDTPSRLLHQHRIGLRVRRWRGGGEQTIKFAGQQQGAMSARPEYNVPTVMLVPNLSLFPAHIWPAKVLGKLTVNGLNKQLEKQFEVTFTRRTWLYEQGCLKVEIALDQGCILALRKREVIQELELELKAGNAEKLFALGASIAKRFNLTPGQKSKAQRGYELHGHGGRG